MLQSFRARILVASALLMTSSDGATLTYSLHGTDSTCQNEPTDSGSIQWPSAENTVCVPDENGVGSVQGGQCDFSGDKPSYKGAAHQTTTDCTDTGYTFNFLADWSCVNHGDGTYAMYQCCEGIVCEVASDPCFPSYAMVTKADNTPARVDSLKEGDAIVAATAEGDLTTDTVTLVSIAMPEASAPALLSLTTASNATLTLTPEHHVSVGAACCSTLKKAKEMRVGETVWAATAGTAAVSTTIVAISKAHGKGLHSPVLMNGGFPVVDGIVTSFDAIEKVTLARHGLAPLLQACKATGTCQTWRDLFLGEDKKYLA